MDGDSGGPVMQVVGDRVVQVGVTSRGFQKAINNKVYDAGIYVNLGAYSKWIEKTAKFGTSSLIMSDHCSEYQFDSKVQVFIRDN
uniref:Peptidase S1 domain-containing protein n=1 Tax=Panagrellus redivivus TaxID=6233 RepID=A0A7E4V7F2_PANRE